MFVSRIQIIGPGENNFVKWKETFRSDRLDKIRSVSVKARIAKASQLEHERRPVGVNVFFLSTGKVTLLHETGFLHIKGIKTFGYEIVIEKESEKISKFSKKIILKPL